MGQDAGEPILTLKGDLLYLMTQREISKDVQSPLSAALRQIEIKRRNGGAKRKRGEKDSLFLFRLLGICFPFCGSVFLLTGTFVALFRPASLRKC